MRDTKNDMDTHNTKRRQRTDIEIDLSKEKQTLNELLELMQDRNEWCIKCRTLCAVLTAYNNFEVVILLNLSVFLRSLHADIN